MGQAQDALEARMEEERKSAMEVKIEFKYYLLFKLSIYNWQTEFLWQGWIKVSLLSTPLISWDIYWTISDQYLTMQHCKSLLVQF